MRIARIAGRDQVLARVVQLLQGHARREVAKQYLEVLGKARKRLLVRCQGLLTPDCTAEEKRREEVSMHVRSLIISDIHPTRSSV